jgi:metallophosphoesterase superfamily enzyme
MPAAARELLTRLTANIDWVWIVGNHDAGIVDHCGGRIEEECETGGIILRHEAAAHEERPEMSGHYHPKFRLNLRGRSVSRRCFVASQTKLILPAYGAFTGGLDAGHPEIVRKVGSGASALVPVSDRLLRFPVAA